MLVVLTGNWEFGVEIDAKLMQLKKPVTLN